MVPALCPSSWSFRRRLQRWLARVLGRPILAVSGLTESLSSVSEPPNILLGLPQVTVYKKSQCNIRLDKTGAINVQKQHLRTLSICDRWTKLAQSLYKSDVMKRRKMMKNINRSIEDNKLHCSQRRCISLRKESDLEIVHRDTLASKLSRRMQISAHHLMQEKQN